MIIFSSLEIKLLNKSTSISIILGAFFIERFRPIFFSISRIIFINLPGFSSVSILITALRKVGELLLQSTGEVS